MFNTTSPDKASGAETQSIKLDWLAAVLSYLVPGLGQIVQGRVGKGLLFLVCIYFLFFFGMYLGDWKNVYLTFEDPGAQAGQFGGGRHRTTDLLLRVHYYGQFWVGIAAWPAIYQYARYDPNKDADPLLGTFQRVPKEDEVNELQVNGDKTWDLAWVYTVIAGVLNVLVIYDALAGPAFQPASDTRTRRPEEPAHT